MMWWLIIIGVFLIVMAFLKFEHVIKKWKIIVLLIVLIFLFFSIRAIIQDNNANIVSPSGIANTAYLYFNWLGEKGLQFLTIGKTAINTMGNSIKEIKPEDADRK